MESKIFYNKTTILTFLAIGFVFFIITPFFTSSNFGGGYQGIPFTYYTWNTTFGLSSEFNLLPLILDIIIYYIVAVFISILLSKSKKK